VLATFGIDTCLSIWCAISNGALRTCSKTSVKTTVEARFQALGEIDGRVYMLVFTPRGGDVHVISLRKANRREIKRYEEEKEIPRD